VTISKHPQGSYIHWDQLTKDTPRQNNGQAGLRTPACAR
jgi:hypothetical protein